VNTVHDTTNVAKDKAAEVGSQVSDQAKSQVDTRTTQAGDQLQDKAEGLHQMSDQLRDSGQDAFAQLAGKLASFTEDAARYLRDGDADSMMGDVEAFARRQPWAVAAGGLFLGFAASRIVKAGTDRRAGSAAAGRYGTGSGPDSIDLTRGYGTTGAATGSSYGEGYGEGTTTGLGTGYAVGATTGVGTDLGPDYATGTTGYEPLGSDEVDDLPDDPFARPVSETETAPLGDPDLYPTRSTQSGSDLGSYTDGNR